MGVQKETRLQQKVREMILARKGYSKKNWGSMTSEPGVADVTVCYRGLYIAFECKVDQNEPSAAQGIHARNVQRAGGITAAVWSVQEAKEVLDICDHYLDLPNQLPVSLTIDHISSAAPQHSYSIWLFSVYQERVFESRFQTKKVFVFAQDFRRDGRRTGI